MDTARDAADPTAQKRLQIQRRAKRGLVASYIHGLSVRHGEGSRPDPAGLGSPAVRRGGQEMPA
jgi:hypothetical protein